MNEEDRGTRTALNPVNMISGLMETSNFLKLEYIELSI
jgi:hypothetical protein